MPPKSSNIDSGHSSQPIFPIREYIDDIWRRKLGFILAFIVVAGIGAVYTMHQPKIYEATAVVIINPEPPTINPVDSTSYDQWYMRDTYYDTQLKVMQSRLVAQRVVRDLNIASDPEFLELDDITNSELLEKRIAAANPVSFLLSKLKVEAVVGTRLVNIRVKHKNPEYAAMLANAIADAYSAQNTEHRSASLTNTYEFIDKQYKENIEKLDKSRDALNDFKQNNKILYTNPIEQQKITNQRLDYLNVKRVEIETETRRTGNLLQELKALPLSTEYVQAFALLGDAPALNAEMNECKKLEQKSRELLVTYLEKSPHVTAVQSQIEKCRESVLNGMKNVITGLSARHQALLKLNQETQAEIVALQKEALSIDQLKLLYEQFQSQKENAETQYESSQAKLNEVSLNRLLEINNIRILDKAIAPTVPVSPNIFLNAIMTFLAAVIAGFVAVLLLELLDISVRSQADVEEKARLPFLGAVPKFPKLHQYAQRKAYRFILENPRSPVAECIRTLTTTLQFLLKSDNSHVLLITSAQPLEGKTMTSINIAVTLALSGKRVALLEADMRRPTIFKALKVQAENGLSAVIEGTAKLKDVLKQTEVPGLQLIPCGTIPQNPAELFQTDGFAKLLADLKAQFDAIIIDSPPVTAVTDALIIAQHVHGVIVIARANKTPLPSLIRTRELLEGVNAPILGVVLNDMTENRSSYGGYYYYHKAYKTAQ